MWTITFAETLQFPRLYSSKANTAQTVQRFVRDDN